MAPRPVRHPLHEDRAAVVATRASRDRAARRRAIAAHPAGAGRLTVVHRARHSEPVEQPLPRPAREDGSMTTEYGLLVVVGATIASLVIRWASGGAVFELLDDVLTSAGRLLGF